MVNSENLCFQFLLVKSLIAAQSQSRHPTQRLFESRLSKLDDLTCLTSRFEFCIFFSSFLLEFL